MGWNDALFSVPFFGWEVTPRRLVRAAAVPQLTAGPPHHETGVELRFVD